MMRQLEQQRHYSNANTDPDIIPMQIIIIIVLVIKKQ